MKPYNYSRPEPLKCAACDGTRWQLEKRATRLYTSGFVTVAVACTVCGGTGRAVEAEAKFAAAGDVA